MNGIIAFWEVLLERGFRTHTWNTKQVQIQEFQYQMSKSGQGTFSALLVIYSE